MNRMGIYRILDANGNRACEGLRVAEDICRFIMESVPITQRFKTLRHRIVSLLRHMDEEHKLLLVSRDSDSDIGADRLALTGGHKESFSDLLSANCKRAQEAIRTLEEISQIINPKFSGEFASIRFELYSLEKEATLKFPNARFKQVDLYVLTDSNLSKGRKTEEVIRQAILGGVKAIQLRDPKLSLQEKLVLGAKLRKLTREHNVLFIVNDRPDLAFALQADGVHLGQDDFPVQVARKLLGRDIIIGKSTHHMKQAIQAERDGADYISVGPIFETSSKEDALAPVGIKLLREIRQKITLPIVAIGGINRSNIKQVISAGADSVAVISAVVSARDIKNETAQLIGQMKRKQRK